MTLLATLTLCYETVTLLAILTLWYDKETLLAILTYRVMGSCLTSASLHCQSSNGIPTKRNGLSFKRRKSGHSEWEREAGASWLPLYHTSTDLKRIVLLLGHNHAERESAACMYTKLCRVLYRKLQLTPNPVSFQPAVICLIQETESLNMQYTVVLQCQNSAISPTFTTHNHKTQIVAYYFFSHAIWSFKTANSKACHWTHTWFSYTHLYSTTPPSFLTILTL